MAVEVIVSDHPCLGQAERPGEPAKAGEWRASLVEAGHKAVIVVPTSRRRRMMVRELGITRVILPRITTLQGLIGDISTKIGSSHRPIGSAEQALMMAKALANAGFHAGPGLVNACLMRRQRHRDQIPPVDPAEAAHPLDKAVMEYEALLAASGVADGANAADLVSHDLDQYDSIIARHVREAMPLVLLDGFHHFTTPELKFLESLGRETEVRLWLSGSHGQPWHEDANRILEAMAHGVGHTFLDESPCEGTLASFGRALFTLAPENAPESVSLVEVTQEADLPDWVATKVASLLRADAALAETPGNIAIVAPDASRATAIREALTRAGIPCSAQAEWIGVADSRPARMVRAALECRSGRFHHGDIYQLLASPVMRGGLEGAHWLQRLRALGIGYLRSQCAQEWLGFWNRAIDAEAAREGANPDAIEALRQLAGSVANRLEMVAGVFGSSVDAAKPGAWLTRQLGLFLEQLDYQNKLMPRYAPPAIPDREIEEDQLAWRNLVDALDSLAETPARHFPMAGGQPDILLALNLVLASDRFTLRSHDTDRVGIIRPLALRGLKLDTVIWAGLNEGEYPPSGRADDDLSADERHRKSREWRYLFAQAFEAGAKRVVLARARQRGEEERQPGPCWTHVAERGIEAVIEAPGMDEATGLRRAMAAPLPAEIVRWSANQHRAHLEEWAVPLVAARWGADKAFSATVLESFVACPFRFHAEKTLRLKDESEDRLALTYGTAVHAALANLEPAGQPFPPTSAALRVALDNELSNQSAYLEVYHRRQGERLSKREWHKALHNSVSLGSEVEFNITIGTDDKGRDVRVTGQIDIVVELADKSRAVIDFKTGSLSTQRGKCSDGRLVQPGLYGHVARVGCENLPGTQVQIHAAYVGLGGTQCDILPSHGMPETSKAKNSKTIPLDLAMVPQTIVGHAGSIRAGTISLTTFGPDSKKPECTSYCSMRDACRYSTAPQA